MNKGVVRPNRYWTYYACKLTKNKRVSTEVIEKICKELECNIGDAVDYVKDL